MIFGFFKGKGAQEEAGKAGHYDALGPQAVSDINRFAGMVGKDWQTTVTHRNFDRSPFDMQVKLFLESQERELMGGKFPIMAALVKNGQVNHNTVMFEAMSRAVVKIGAVKLLSAFEGLKRKVD
jgi:hypothetical protein